MGVFLTLIIRIIGSGIHFAYLEVTSVKCEFCPDQDIGFLSLPCKAQKGGSLSSASLKIGV